MSRRNVAAAALALLAGPFAVADEPASPRPPPSAGSSAARIVVTVGSFRNRDGALGCRLYHAPAGFPESSAGTVEQRVAITGDVARCVFADVAPGTYAVSVMHDENGNRTLDKNFLGVPKEGYGVSNNHTHALRSPSWEESRFSVEAGKPVELTIRLRY